VCLAIPAKIIEIQGATATVDVAGNVRQANLSLVEGVKVGDYVMVHAGFAITTYEPEEAERTLELMKELFSEAR
jgi:hydrogenase expression/formation protein HypC